MTREEMKRLLVAVHQSIEESADSLAEKIAKGDSPTITYPPNGGLSADERDALKTLTGGPSVQTGLRKLIADAAASVVFDLFNYVDGTADPPGEDYWGTFHIGTMTKEEARAQVFLHDAFYETYWEWRNSRANKGWYLDTLDDSQET